MKRKRMLAGMIVLALSAALALGLADKQLNREKPITAPSTAQVVPKSHSDTVILMTPLPQSSPQFDLSHSVISGGGGTSSSENPNFELSGTIGQSAAGTTSTSSSGGSEFTITGGFWNAQTTQTPAPTPTPTPGPTPAPGAPTVFVEHGTVNRAVAIDSVTFVKGPFRVLTSYNFSADGHTRVILFTTNLGLNQPDPTLLTVQAAGFPLTVENVGTVSGVVGLDSSYIVVRLPDGLPAGDLPLLITLRGVPSSNFPTISISP